MSCRGRSALSRCFVFYDWYRRSVPLAVGMTVTAEIVAMPATSLTSTLANQQRYSRAIAMLSCCSSYEARTS